jgi:hypothetical protein
VERWIQQLDLARLYNVFIDLQSACLDVNLGDVFLLKVVDMPCKSLADAYMQDQVAAVWLHTAFSRPAYVSQLRAGLLANTRKYDVLQNAVSLTAGVCCKGSRFSERLQATSCKPRNTSQTSTHHPRPAICLRIGYRLWAAELRVKLHRR